MHHRDLHDLSLFLNAKITCVNNYECVYNRREKGKMKTERERGREGEKEEYVPYNCLYTNSVGQNVATSHYDTLYNTAYNVMYLT